MIVGIVEPGGLEFRFNAFRSSFRRRGGLLPLTRGRGLGCTVHRRGALRALIQRRGAGQCRLQHHFVLLRPIERILVSLQLHLQVRHHGNQRRFLLRQLAIEAQLVGAYRRFLFVEGALGVL